MNTITSSSTTGSADSLLQPSTGVAQRSIMQTDFLTLLTAQLKYQDPFNPTDNADLVAQMATISNTSGIAEMNQSLASIKETLAGNRLGDAASWIDASDWFISAMPLVLLIVAIWATRSALSVGLNGS